MNVNFKILIQHYQEEIYSLFQSFYRKYLQQQKYIFIGKHRNLELPELELKNCRSYCRPQSCDRIVYRNSCEI